MSYFFGGMLQQEELESQESKNKINFSIELLDLPETLGVDDWYIYTKFIKTSELPETMKIVIRRMKERNSFLSDFFEILYKKTRIKKIEKEFFNKELVKWSANMEDY